MAEMNDTADTGATEAGTGAQDRAGRRAARKARRDARGRRKPAHWRLVHALWSGMIGVFVLCFLAVALFAGLGRSVKAPDWMRSELALQVEASVDGNLKFSFGDISLVVGEGWRPRARFRDLRLSRPNGTEVLRLADAEVSFSVSSLMQGEIRPKTVLVTGAFATLRMSRDGTVALSLGDNATPLEEAQNIPQLIESWDVAMESPILAALTSLELQALTMRYEDGRAGRAWTVDGGSVLVQRDGQDLRLNGTFALLSGRDYASTISANYASRIGDLAAEFGVTITDIAAEDVASQSVALGWLDILRAPISGAIRGGIDSDGQLRPLNATLQIGEGVVQPSEATRPIPFRQARSYFTYDPSDQSLAFDELSVESPWVTGLAEGTAYLNGVEQGRLTDLVGQFRLSALRLNPYRVYDTPLELSGATADFRLQLQPFRLRLGQLQISDGDSSVRLSGQLRAQPEGWDVALDAAMDQLTPARLLEVWPRNTAPKPRQWVADNMYAGTLQGVDFALRVRPGQPPNTYLDFDFAGAEVQVAKWLPPLTGGQGTVTLVDRRFVVTATQGGIDSGGYGSVDVAGTSFIIPDIAVKPDTPAIARVQAEGPVAAVLALLNRPPLSVLKNSTLPVDLAQGQVRASGTLALPLKKGTQFEETHFHVSGLIRDVDSTVLVPGHRVSADALEIDVTQDRVILRGPGRISGVPARVEWTQEIGTDAAAQSRLVGSVELSEQMIDAFRIGLPPGALSGQGQGRIDIALQAGKPPELRLTSDLTGVRLAIPALGWAKPASASGSLDLRARLGAVPEVTRLAIDAGGLVAEGRIQLRPDGGLDRAVFSNVRLGGWLSAPVEIVGQGKSRPVALRVRGGRLDMRRAAFGQGQGEGGPMSISLDRLQITDTIVLDGFRGEFRGGATLSGPFSGRLGGRTPITGEAAPSDGRSAFRITSGDAGGVLRDAGLLTQARGGSFDMTLTPTGAVGQYEGRAAIRNTRVINAPAIAALLDAASIIGLLDEMTGAGIQFGQVQARFQIAPGKVTLYESSAVGPSMGLTMNGVYHTEQDQLAMQGVISPFYLINGIGAVVSRRGEGLIGFNYALRGSAGAPKVRVNPLSALAPGILRDALREPAPAAPEQQRKTDPQPPAAEPQTGGAAAEGR